MAGLFSQIPPLRTQGVIDPLTWGGHRGLVVGVYDCEPTGRAVQICLRGA